MTATVAPTPGPPVIPPARRRSRARWWWIALPVALVGFVLLMFAGRPTVDRPPPLSPDSEWPDGTKGLVLLLGDVGADVTVTSDAPSDVDDLDGTDVLLITLDYLYELDEIAAIREWVDLGGRLVVLDPYSQFTEVTEGTAPGTLASGACTIDALAGLDEIRTGGDAAMYTTYFGDDRCFSVGDTSFVVAVEQGDGTVVSVGGPTVFSNALLDQADNAGLAVALLAPEPGTRVRVMDLAFTVPPPDVERPDAPVPNPLSGFLDALPERVRLPLLQVILAFVAYAWWRGRRIGRPVREPQAVEVEGSELVQAVGRLMARSRDPARAAAVLRDDLRRALCDRLGLPRDVDTSVLVRVAAERTATPETQVAAALTGPPVVDDAGLIDLARLIETIRQEVLHGTAP